MKHSAQTVLASTEFVKAALIEVIKILALHFKTTISEAQIAFDNGHKAFHEMAAKLLIGSAQAMADSLNKKG